MQKALHFGKPELELPFDVVAVRPELVFDVIEDLEIDLVGLEKDRGR